MIFVERCLSINKFLFEMQFAEWSDADPTQESTQGVKRPLQ